MHRPPLARCLALVLVTVGVGLALGAAPVAAAPLLRVYYPDIEQGSATLVVSPTGHALLVDGGTGLKEVEDGVEDLILDLMDAGVVTSLDYVVATHYDEDHIGRLENVFALVDLAPGAIAYDRGTFHSTPSTFAYADYVAGAALFGRTTIAPGTVLDLGGGVTVTCLVVNGDLPDASSVDPTASGQFENSASVAVLVEYGDFDLWIGGDLTGNVEVGVTDVESSTAPFAGDVDVYTFNHHGSNTSSTAAFLDTLEAEIGINQSSVENDFGHPNEIVVQRFLATLDSFGNTPLFFQQNPGNPTDERSDDSLATAIADCDDVDSVGGRPGTMTLFSDGTSYQLSGCGFGTYTVGADEGVGTIGDYPPAVFATGRTPFVPTALETVTVTATAVDEGAVSAELRWWLDGVAQTAVPMTLASGTWSGTLPAQADGAKVRYRVAVTDSASAVTLSPAEGYFAGTTDIATIRENDADGVLVPKGYGARLEGDVTVEDGIFHPFVSQVYLQDATGAVQVFETTLLGLSRGDRLEVVGALEQFGGMTELSLADDVGNTGHTVLSSGTPPAPTLVTVAQVDESLEGQLVRIDDVTVISGIVWESGNSSLTISDDGGVSTLELRIDEDTDIPGVATPTQPFDVIGVISQFESMADIPFDGGYQLQPRERTDLVSAEVNPPALLINEIHADPDPTLGDANGDGVVSSTGDEFVELYNTTGGALDISGWTLSDAVGIKFTFPAATVVPARELVVVFASGTPTGTFGNAAANGLVFVAGSLGLNNTGDTVTVADDQAVTIDSVTYGSAGGNDESLNRDPDFANVPLALHSAVAGAVGVHSPGTRVDGIPATIPVGAVLLTEVLYNPDGTDAGLEWIELYNAATYAVDLSELCLGAGGSDYTSTAAQLGGVVQPGATWVIGGPTSSAANGSPVYDEVEDLTSDLQNGGSTADGVALFNVRCAQVDALTVPIDAVVYGDANLSGLIDETGVASSPEVGNAGSGQSIERVDAAGAWQVRAIPDPNQWAPAEPPPPPVGLLLSEVYYNAPSADDGFEWVEIYNPTEETVDLAGYSLGNGGTSYTSSLVQLSGTLGPGELFVVGGATSDGTNGNPTYDQVANFSPDFQNSGTDGDGVALFGVAAALVTGSTVPIDAVVYGPNNTNGLIDETGSANSPEVGNAPEGSSIERLDAGGTWQIQSTPTPNASPLTGGGGPGGDPGYVILSEVFYDPNGGDNGKEWVELYNPGDTAVDLAGYSLGAGGSDYTTTTVQLSGSLAGGANFVVGGATSNGGNGNPTYDQVFDFSGGLQNSGATADGVALFDVVASSIGPSTVPIDAVVYGGANGSGLIDETGSASAPEVGDAASGSSISRTDLAGSWTTGSPTPNATSLP